MNMDEFKRASKEQLIEYGKTIKLGSTYDSNNNLLTFRDSTGYWSEYTYDSNDNLLTHKNSTGYWDERTYDSNNNELTYKNSNRYWSEKTHDSNNNVLTFKDSKGYTFEYTYDSNNNQLTHKDSNGYYYELLCIGKKYNLMYDKNKRVYKAGCQELNYKDCIEFFNTEGKDYIDAELFMKTIHQNESRGNY